MKQKYVRLKDYDSIIIFPEVIQHREFKHMDVVSAGFCYVDPDSVKCFGESVSLGLKSKPEDSEIATKQVFGDDSW
jgi:hypothetical protein